MIGLSRITKEGEVDEFAVTTAVCLAFSRRYRPLPYRSRYKTTATTTKVTSTLGPKFH